MRPVVLELDDSVGPLDRRLVIPLAHWSQRLRFGCATSTLQAFGRALESALPLDTGTVFTGSGDFHHLSLPLIERASARHGPLDVVIFDNHPDNMRFPFGIHCGSWVRAVSALPRVGHVHVVGITSHDIAPAHAWENYLLPLFKGRLTYWSIGARVGWAHALGLRRSFRNYASTAALLDAFGGHMAARDRPLYLSIDKDVLSIEDARTNWDQGVMREAELGLAIEHLRGYIVGSDITGDLSVASYCQWWKRALSALDRQPRIPPQQLSVWQAQQHAVNQRLLMMIDDASVTS